MQQQNQQQLQALDQDQHVQRQPRPSRNNKKHHTTHAAGNNRQRNPKVNAQQNNETIACKICRQDLQETEKEFFACNCKYKICQKCFWHQVNHENGKCPNCGLLYEVNRVRDYYAKKQVAINAQIRGPSMKRMRSESPQPSSIQNSLIQSLDHSTSLQAMDSSAVADLTSGGKQINQKSRQGQKEKVNKGQAKGTRQKPQNTPKQSQASQPAQVSVDANLVDPLTKQLSTVNSQRHQLVAGGGKKQRNSSEHQRIQQKLSQVRILQRNTLYIIGLSPNVAKEETLRRYEYFSQYGRIQTITINKEKAFQSENQGICLSAYINYSSERDASLAILAVDQFVFDGRLLHASYGRTKYCRFFLKGTNCLNHECPYLHKEAHPENILTQEDMNKKLLFQQCQQLALKLSKLQMQTEEQFRIFLRAHKDGNMRAMKLHNTNRMIMPQLEPVFEKKGLFRHCIGVTPATESIPSIPVQQQPHQLPIQQAHNQIQNMAGTGSVMPLNKNYKPIEQVVTLQGNTADITGQITTPFKHRGSEGCHSENQMSQYNMMMFGGRGRLQSSGTLGELDFMNKTVSGQSRQQLIPNGSTNQNRRFAQDDHYLARMPPGFQLTANPTNQPPQNKAFMTHTNQNNFGQFQQPRRGSPHPPQTRLFFNQQFMAVQQQTTLHKTGSETQFFSSKHMNQRDSDNATQQSSSYLAKQQSITHQSLMQNNYPRHFLQQDPQVPTDARARSGSQVATTTASKNQFQEAQMPHPRRKSSHAKLRVFDEQSKGMIKKEEQRFFAEALRQKLNQAIKNDIDQRYTQEVESTGQFSSIFAGERHANKILPIQNNNFSEGLAGGHACSPIRDSILQSRRGSEDYGTLGRPRSQHSLIVESVARILDDTALEQRGDRERRMIQMLNEPNFKTGPPSEVPKQMHEMETMAMNSQFYNDIESKWNNQFDINSSNSLNLTNPAMAGKQALQKSQGEYMMSCGNQNTFTSPGMNTSTGVWNMSSSLYNSPFFLIPTHTSNQQHRSAAFHDNSLRHLQSQANAFQMGGNSTAIRTRANQDMFNDTMRLTFNPHPLLPRGPPGAYSSNLSSTGGMFKNTTKSDPEQGIPMLNRTPSQPFMMRSEQKLGRNLNANQEILNQSYREQAQLTQRNLEILNKKYCPSKDMLYAKIFTDYKPSSPTMGNRNQVSSFGGAPQHPISVQHYITPQSLFCFALDGDDSNDLRQQNLRNIKLQKQVSRDTENLPMISTPTRRKDHFFKVKDTSQTPTNKHSRQRATNWNQNSASNALSHNLYHNSGLVGREIPTATSDELEMANQLANEASMGFGDLFSIMHSKSKKSLPGGGTTKMSAVDGDVQPHRSRSQSNRDNRPSVPQEIQIRNSSGGMYQESENQLRRDKAGSHRSPPQKSKGSDSSGFAQQRNLTMTNQQQTSQGHSAATATIAAGPKNYYLEFVKVQEGFRKSSGLISSSGFGATKVETRRSSYSQGRNSSSRSGIQLMDVTKRNSFKAGQVRKSMIISPLGLLKFKNHQIDEVNEDGATVRDEKIENEETRSDRMNSADRQSYNLKTLNSVSRSRKASQSGNNFD